MLFFPFMADVRLPHFPFITILITILCLTIYWQQAESDIELAEYTSNFCSKQEGRIYNIVLKKIAASKNYQGEDVCEAAFTAIHLSRDTDETINNLIKDTTKFSSKSTKQTHAYMHLLLSKMHSKFNINSPVNLTNQLKFDPEEFNILRMISSAFAHADWGHVIGNLFFFFAFAATVELLVGSMYFVLIILGLAIGTNTTYLLAVQSTTDSVPTLGLSGVVMGMIGLFIYFIPKAKIRCLFWFIFIIRKFGIPAWLLATWYFGWDVYDLYRYGSSTGTNLIAHVSGFAQGYLIGLLLFKSRKIAIHEEIKRVSNNEQLSQVWSS